MKYNLPAIREKLVNHFNESELRDVCFELDVDYEDMSGTNKSDTARELLTYLNRRGLVIQLIAHCQEIRPQVEWNHIKTQTDQNKEFVNTIGLSRAKSSIYLESKFEIHRTAWQILHELKLAGDELWALASKENVLNFASLLKQANAFVNANAYLFNESDYQQLLVILEQFGRFSVGKTTLIKLREGNPSITSQKHWKYIRYSGDVEKAVEEQIQRNGEIKHLYEDLLKRICNEFRNRLDSWASTN